MSAMEFRKRPVVIEAIRWTGGNSDDVLAFAFADERWKEGIDSEYVGGPGIGFTPTLGEFDIPTLEGTMTASAGDWIIRGVKGELYPCKPDIFRLTYVPDDDDYVWCEVCDALTHVDALVPEVENTPICGGCGAEA